MRIVVAGAGIAGSAAALLLGRDGHEVVLVERDTDFPLHSAQSAFSWPRAGIPHFFQPHAFLPRGTMLLKRHLPDVYRQLLDAGAWEWDAASRIAQNRIPEDAELKYLAARRPMIEWALRHAIANEPAIRMHCSGRITGLLGDAAEVPRVRGVTLSDRGTVAADLVVDALGRSSLVPQWIEHLGGKPLRVESTSAGCIYYSRYFQLRDGAELPLEGYLTTPRGDLGYAAFATFFGDNRTFALLFAVPPQTHQLRMLKENDVWMRFAQNVRGAAPLVRPEFATPITDVMPMGGLQNTLRHFQRADGKLAVLGLLPVADAFCHTDPSFALGLSLSLIHAVALLEGLREESTNVEQLAHDYFGRIEPECEERYALACEIDSARTRMWLGERIDCMHANGNRSLFSLVAASIASLHNDEVCRRTLRRHGFLDRVAAFDDDVVLHGKIESIVASLAKSPAPAQAPPLREMLARVTNTENLTVGATRQD